MREIKMNICLETATRWYNGTEEVLKQLAIVAYPELAKKELPKSWEDLEEIEGFFVEGDSLAGYAECLTSEINRNVFATREQAEASIALAQLSQLREVYRNGWKPDFSQCNTKKYCIYYYENKLKSEFLIQANTFLSFQDEHTQKLFLENFRDLIEKAKPLLS